MAQCGWRICSSVVKQCKMSSILHLNMHLYPTPNSESGWQNSGALWNLMLAGRLHVWLYHYVSLVCGIDQKWNKHIPLFSSFFYSAKCQGPHIFICMYIQHSFGHGYFCCLIIYSFLEIWNPISIFSVSILWTKRHVRV